jgi:tetratricopeptide (TPR) repeat protein
VEVSDQCHLWAEAYNRTLDDIITIQTDVAGRVANSLALELLPSHRNERSHSSNDSIAFEAYLKGRFCWNKRNESGFIKALKYFQTAIERAPDYPPPYVGMADVYKIAALYSGLPHKEAFDKSRSAIAKALQLDNNYAEAHASLAYDKFLFEWDFQGAERAFQHALELNPNHVTGHYWYALYLAAMKRSSEAIAQIDLAMELDPLSLIANCNKGQVLYFARRFDEAVAQLLDTIEMDEHFPRAFPDWSGLSADGPVRKTHHSNSSKRGKRRTTIRRQRRVLYAAKSAAEEKIEAMANPCRIAKQKTNPIRPARTICRLAYLGMGDKTRALDCLERACDERRAHLQSRRRSGLR